jgi:hypothetical protein
MVVICVVVSLRWEGIKVLEDWVLVSMEATKAKRSLEGIFSS